MKMRIPISFLVLCLAWSVAADERSLYSGEVRVERAVAADAATFRQALAAVLFKHTGDRDTAGAMAAAAGDPEQFILGYQFREVDVPGFDRSPETERRLLVEFDPPSIDRLVSARAVARWSRERPDLLVWLVLEDEQGVRFLPPDADWLHFALDDGAERHGLFLVFPLYDGADLAQVNPEDVRRGDAAGARQSAARYGTAGTLLIDLRHDGGDDWDSTWYWFAGDREAEFTLADAQPEALITAGMVQLAGQLADSYRPGESLSTDYREMVVGGLRSDAHYAELLRFLQGLSMVNRVHVLRVRGDRIYLGLDLGAGGLEDAVVLGRLLEPAPPEGDTLHYRMRW